MLPLQIAIDGPVASGKGDIAARLAKKFHFTYIYTGAMYRALALACIERGIVPVDTRQVFHTLKAISITLLPTDGSDSSACKIELNGKDVTERITQPDVASLSSHVATIPEVRVHMVSLQQQMVEGKSVVMEGRDIGYRVLPNAQMKIYLTASLEERSRRRWQQWKEKGINKTLEEVLRDTEERDRQDRERSTDPLKKLPDAWELDTTAMTQDDVIRAISEELSRRNLL